MQDLIEVKCGLARQAVIDVLNLLTELDPSCVKSTFDPLLTREMKAQSDKILEDILVSRLKSTGIEILSEESGVIPGGVSSTLRWVVDPMDGTINFMRGLAPCAISVALCDGNTPIWGVIGEYPSGEIYWGGAEYGAFHAGNPISVSSVQNFDHAVICSGIPSRFKRDDEGVLWIKDNLLCFGKVRMLGAASLSLLSVARGSAEAYAERSIMLWDVAAGLAIVQGAGGIIEMKSTEQEYVYDVYAHNGLIRKS
jgi:myo-inositol-1(or 4)-monophosphatase